MGKKKTSDAGSSQQLEKQPIKELREQFLSDFGSLDLDAQILMAGRSALRVFPHVFTPNLGITFRKKLNDLHRGAAFAVLRPAIEDLGSLRRLRKRARASVQATAIYAVDAYFSGAAYAFAAARAAAQTAADDYAAAALYAAFAAAAAASYPGAIDRHGFFCECRTEISLLKESTQDNLMQVAQRPLWPNHTANIHAVSDISKTDGGDVLTEMRERYLNQCSDGFQVDELQRWLLDNFPFDSTDIRRWAQMLYHAALLEKEFLNIVQQPTPDEFVRFFRRMHSHARELADEELIESAVGPVEFVEEYLQTAVAAELPKKRGRKKKNQPLPEPPEIWLSWLENIHHDTMQQALRQIEGVIPELPVPGARS